MLPIWFARSEGEGLDALVFLFEVVGGGIRHFGDPAEVRNDSFRVVLELDSDQIIDRDRESKTAVGDVVGLGNFEIGVDHGRGDRVAGDCGGDLLLGCKCCAGGGLIGHGGLRLKRDFVLIFSGGFVEFSIRRYCCESARASCALR